MWNLQEAFLIILSLFANLKLMSVLFIHETFLCYNSETFANCKEVKQIMIMIITIIYIFFILWDIWSTVEKNPQSPLWKNLPHPFLLTPPLNIRASHPFLPTLKLFPAPPAERCPPLFGSWGHYAFFSKNGLILPNFGLLK